MRSRRRLFGLGVSLAIAVALLTSVAAVAQAPYTVVASGLESPRGLTFGPGGRLYVAQAGNGGDSSKITEIRYPWTGKPTVRDVITGLPSVGDEGEFTGADGVSALGNGTIYAIMSASNAATQTQGSLGHLLQVTTAGQVRDVANVGDFNYAWTGDHQDLAYGDFPDANPYGVLALPEAVYVVDAGANTLDRVHHDGSIQVLAYFPDNAIRDSTPTCVVKGPDGALYVGTLALVDSLVVGPSAKVYRVAVDAPSSSIFNAATIWATGLWPINGCAFGPDGSFYASELFTVPDFSHGDVVKIPWGDPTTHTSLTNGSLLIPAGVAVGPDGSVYVSNHAAFVPGGEVVRLANK